jgi:hypothetical protein
MLVASPTVEENPLIIITNLQMMGEERERRLAGWMDMNNG